MPAPSVSLGALVRLALPATAFTVLTHGFRAVDQYFIRTVSMEAQAAIGASVFVLVLFSGLAELVAAGAAPLVARASGAEDPDARRRALSAGIAGALGVAVLVALTGGLGSGLVVQALGLSGRTALEADRYLSWLSWTALPLVLTPLVDLCLLAMGRARAPMLLHGLSLALNIVLTPWMIHGLGLGVAGAALASNVSRAATTSVGLWWLARASGLRPADLLDLTALGRVLRIGTPMGLGTVLYALVYWALLETSISPLGPHVNAALGIGFSALEGVSWPCFHGVSLATASLVGRALGAGDPAAARTAIRRAFPILSGLGLAAGAIFYFAAVPLTGLFAADERVHAAAIEYATILAASQVFVAWEALYEGVLAGAGDTRAVFWTSVPLNLLRVPLSWALAFPLGLGAAGVWWAINLTTMVKAALKAWMVRSDGWIQRSA